MVPGIDKTESGSTVNNVIMLAVRDSRVGPAKGPKPGGSGNIAGNGRNSPAFSKS